MFSSYIESPGNYLFEGQDADEEILLLLRAHPITNLTWILQVLFLLSLPFVLPPIILALGFSEVLNLPSNFRAGFTLLNYLLVLIVSFEGFLYWYFNVYIITNKQVVDINFQSLLFKNVDLAPLENIEEADSSVGGLMGTIFNFGNVAIQTAGATIAVDMRNIPHPAQVADMILDIAKKHA